MAERETDDVKPQFIGFRCPDGHKIKAPIKLAGKAVRCPHKTCGRSLTVPTPVGRAASTTTDQPGKLIAISQATEPAPSSPSVPPPPVPPSPTKQPDSIPTKTEPAKRSPDWAATLDMRDHKGNKLPKGVEFFMAPPAEIGTVVSAYSTLKEGEQPMKTGPRTCWILGATFVSAAVGVGIVFAASITSLIWVAVWILLPTLLGCLIAVGMTEFTHGCSYVGTEGAVRYNCVGTRDKITGDEVFLFEPSLQCEHTVVNKYNNTGGYEKSEYRIVWTNKEGEVVYSFHDSYEMEHGLPSIGDDFCYAVAVLTAWQKYKNTQVAINILKLACELAKIQGAKAFANPTDAPPQVGNSSEFQMTVTATMKGVSAILMVACDLQHGEVREGDQFEVSRTGKCGTIGTLINGAETLRKLEAGGNKIVTIGDHNNAEMQITFVALGMDASDFQNGDQIASV